MTDNATPPNNNAGQVKLPTPPKQDIWGRDIPSPQSQSQPDQQAKILAEEVKKLSEENQEIFTDIVKQFQSYTDAIKDSNQNFFLKQGRILISEFRKGVIEGMVKGADESGESDKLSDVNHNLRVIYNNLDRLVAGQTDANKLANEVVKDKKKDDIEAKRDKANQKESDKESFLQKFFMGQKRGDLNKENRDKKNNKREGGILDHLAFLLPSMETLLPLIAVFSLFFVDFKKLMANPVWGDISKMITEKIIPGTKYLIENVFKPLMQFLIDTTLPAVLKGLINLFDDVVTLVKGIIDSFKANSLGEGLQKAFAALWKFVMDVGTHIFDAVASGLGFDPQAIKDYFAKKFGNTIEVLKEYFSHVFDHLMKIFDGLGDMIEGLWKGDMDMLKLGLRKFIIGSVEGIRDMFIDGVNYLVNLVLDLFNFKGQKFDLKDFVVKLVSSSYAFAVDLLTTIKNGLETFVTGTLDAVTKKYAEIKDDISNWVAEKLDAAARIKTAVTDAFWGLVDSIRDSIVAGLTSIKDYFLGLPGKIENYLLDKVYETLPSWMLPEREAQPAASTIAPPPAPIAIQTVVGANGRYAPTTDAMRNETFNRMKSHAPVIIQAPSTVNQSTNVSNGTTINSSPSVGNTRKFLGR